MKIQPEKYGKFFLNVTGNIIEARRSLIYSILEAGRFTSQPMLILYFVFIASIGLLLVGFVYDANTKNPALIPSSPSGNFIILFYFIFYLFFIFKFIVSY
jgi:hypothetical protein